MTLVIHPDVRKALHQAFPVVALESAVLTHGLPGIPVRLDGFPDWRPDVPANLQLARRLHTTVSATGAVPALTCILNGQIHLGLQPDQLDQLCSASNPDKTSARDLAPVMARAGIAGTTVAATLALCSLTSPPIRICSTGGIGGVHRGWTSRPDISADLAELSRTPVCVVCSGAKSILDLPATFELLDALGIPILGFRCDRFPRFVVGGRSDLPVQHVVEDPDQVAEICRDHWGTLRRSSAILVVQDCPPEWAIDHADAERAIELAAPPTGHAATPALLQHLMESTQGRSLRANIALLEANARLASQIALAFGTGSTTPDRPVG